MLMFYITLIFGACYLVLYPGLGKWQGIRGWTSVGQYKEERAQAEAKYQPLYDNYLKQDLKAVAADPKAQEMGKRLFQTYCVQCHGSDARGAKGFPNLTDNDWLWGGDPKPSKPPFRLVVMVKCRPGVLPWVKRRSRTLPTT
jgi:cytochrome c oxidase cbb3-type subunit 3